MECLSVEGLNKSYFSKNKKIQVLNNVSFNIKKGEFVTIMGASGSGKSTLLNIIGMLDAADSGSIILFNQYNVSILSSVEQTKIRLLHIGIVYQTLNLIPFLTVEQNVELPLLVSSKRMNDIDNKNKINHLLKQIGLKERKNHFPNELSLGERQRVALARSMINSPSLILADEPTGNLDNITTKEILNVMKELCINNEIAFLVATHDDNVSEVADRILFLENKTLTVI